MQISPKFDTLFFISDDELLLEFTHREKHTGGCTKLQICLGIAGSHMDGKCRVVFDENGRFWTPEELGARLGTRIGARILCEFVLRNLGFVLVESGFGSHLRVSYCRDAVLPVALTGLVMWLYDYPDRPVVIYESSGRTTGALHHSRDRAAKAISRTISLLAGQTTYSCTLTEVESSVFHNRWRAAAELVATPSLDLHTAQRVLNALFDGYFSIAERREEDDEYRLVFVGDAIRKQFGNKVKGRTYREMYDNNYGNWVADGIRTISARQRPMAQEIVAPINWPGLMKPVLCRYTRLLLPTKSSDRELLVTASHIHSENLH